MNKYAVAAHVSNDTHACTYVFFVDASNENEAKGMAYTHVKEKDDTWSVDALLTLPVPTKE